MNKKIFPLIMASVAVMMPNCFSKKGETEMKYKEQNNIVLNASSENKNNEAALAYDSDYQTYWEAKEKTNQSLSIDLQEIRLLSSVTQIFSQEDIWYFTIEASLDNITFFTLLDCSYGVFGRTYQESCSGYARYIRLTILKSEKGFSPTSKEFYVESTSMEEGINLAYLCNGSASSYAVNYEAAKAFDGNTGTYYCASSAAYPQQIKSEINKINYVNKVILRLQDYGSYEFEILAIDSNDNEVVISQKKIHTGTYFEIPVNGYYKDFIYKVYNGPGWANLVEMQIIGFEEITYLRDGNIYSFESDTFINHIEDFKDVEFSKDGETFVKFDSQEYQNSNKIYRYIRGTEGFKVYGTSLDTLLSMGLCGVMSDYAGEKYHISNTTMNPNRVDAKDLYYKSQTTGGEHFLELDFGRNVNISSIKVAFKNVDSHAYKLEGSLNKITYDTIVDYSNDKRNGNEFVVRENISSYRYVKLTIFAEEEKYVEVCSFEVRGNGSVKRENWWEEESGVIRFYPKLQKVTLREITSRLDEFRYSGYKIIELHQPYEGIADIWAGLGGTNNYQVDPLIGTLDDLSYLLKKAHEKGIKVFMFGNVGYGKYDADYFKKACKDYALGIDSKERNWFVFSDTCKDPTKWFWSDIANAYYYGYWGENGKIPTFNFNNKEWQDETKRYIDFWAKFGVDGIALDAPDVYYWGEVNASQVTYDTITNTLRKNNLFSLPEGSGNTNFISSYKYSGVQNYAMSSWGGGAFSLGINAARNKSAKNVDDNIKPYRDSAVSLGGISIAGMNFEDNYATATETERILESALVTSTGHLAFLHLGSADRPGQDIMKNWPLELQQKIASIFAVSNSLSALNPTGARHKLITQNDDRYYAFFKSDLNGRSRAIPVFNYYDKNANIQIQISGTNLSFDEGDLKIYDAANDETVECKVVGGILQIPVNSRSYRLMIMR